MIKLNTLVENKRGNILFQTPLDVNLEVFDRLGQGLYAWVFRDQYLSGNYKPKFGQYGTYAKEGSTPQETISGYVGTTTDAIVILWAIRLSDEQIQKYGTAYDIEQKVGPHLGSKSKFGSSTEVFETDIDTVKDLVNAILYPSEFETFFKVQKETHLPRLRQEEAIKLFEQYYLANKLSSKQQSLDFLLGAVMRFGKNFTFLEMSRKIVKKAGNVLMITSRPDVFESLKTDVSSHVNYDGWIYDELKEKKYDWKPSNERVNVLAVSTQLLLHKTHRKNLVKMLSKYEWDIRGVDEADTAMLTELSTELLEKLPSSITIWITGTPWKLLSTGKFTAQNSYIYDYIQQQQDKKDGIDKRAISLDWYCMEVFDKIKEQKKWYSDEEGFTLTKLFSWNKETNRFIHEGDVEMFLRSVFGEIPKTKFSPFKIIPELQHTFWVLPPNTEAVKHLKTIIERVTNGNYKVFAATGNETDDISEVKDFLKLNKDTKSIVLSINRFTRGSTVPEWDATFFLNDTDSAEFYFQTAFRPTSPKDGKDRGYVFDFNPNRTLIMLAEYSRYSAQQKGITNPNEILREYLDNFNVYGIDGGVEFKKKTLEDVLSAIRDSDYNAKTLRNSGHDYVMLDKISERLFEMIMGLDKEKSGKLKLEITSSKEFMKKGKNLKNLTKSDRKKFDKTKRDIVARISTLMSRLPIICELGYETVEEIVENLPDNLFYGATKTEKAVLKLLVQEKIIDTYKVNLQLVR